MLTPESPAHVPAQPATDPSTPTKARAGSLSLAIATLGVVYGDIGTSPLYAVRECFLPPHGVAASTANVLGILSLIFWSILLVVVVKYLMFVMRADNDGEGGVLALLALVAPRTETERRQPAKIVLVMLGLFGASLLYGDGMITPAISVLSAVEGLQVATPLFQPVIVPITVAILLALFAVQKHGTARVGAVFGPATLLWFISIAAAGAPWIWREPRVLSAVSPHHAIAFFMANGTQAFLVLGAVVLCITGGEALYADMGHFGRHTIRVTWYAIVLPALLINYFGQGALLMLDPKAAANPFYALVPVWALYPMVAIATLATVVASQALISGAFSLTRQAVQLGYSPRITIIHTSGSAEGQIYIPEVNHILMVACVALVLGFRGSSALAAAYGIAVTGTMAITSILFYFVARERWRWPRRRAGSVVAVFLLIDLSFFVANAAKIFHGGWFPLLVAAAILALMTTWKRGRTLLLERIRSSSLPLTLFLADLESTPLQRVTGTAVFMTSDTDGTPGVLLHHVKHNKVLHDQVVLLSVLSEQIPEVPSDRRVEVERLPMGFFRVLARYGFVETPNVPEILRLCRAAGLAFEENDTSYYLGRETLIVNRAAPGLAPWRKLLFSFLSRNAVTATAFFSIPPNRVVEIGSQIEL